MHEYFSFNTPIWDSVQLHLILIFGKKKGAEIIRTEQIYINNMHHLKKNSDEVEIDCKTELLGDKTSKDHSGNEIKRCMQNIE